MGIEAGKLLDGRQLTDSLQDGDLALGLAVGLVTGTALAILPRVDSRCAIGRRTAYGLVGAAAGLAVGGLVYAVAKDETGRYIAVLISAPFGGAIGALRQCWP